MVHAQTLYLWAGSLPAWEFWELPFVPFIDVAASVSNFTIESRSQDYVLYVKLLGSLVHIVLPTNPSLISRQYQAPCENSLAMYTT